MNKNEKVNAIVIDPETKTIYPTTVTRGETGWKEMKEQIGCNYVELAVNFNEDAMMYCDEEGWCKNDKRHCFKFDGVVVPSKAVIIRDDGEVGYPEPFETGDMFKYISLLIDKVKWLGEKTYDQIYGDREMHEYSEAESIAYYKKQFGCNEDRAKEMMKMFGKVFGC